MSKLTCLLLQQYYLHLNIFVKNKYIEWNVHEKDSGIFICRRNIKPIYIILTKQVTFQSFLNNIGIWEKINIHLCCVNYATNILTIVRSRVFRKLEIYQFDRNFNGLGHKFSHITHS